MHQKADNELAARIVDEISRQQLFKLTLKSDELQKWISNGKLRSEDWVLLVENEILKERNPKNG